MPSESEINPDPTSTAVAANAIPDAPVGLDKTPVFQSQVGAFSYSFGVAAHIRSSLPNCGMPGSDILDILAYSKNHRFDAPPPMKS